MLVAVHVKTPSSMQNYASIRIDMCILISGYFLPFFVVLLFYVKMYF